MDEENKENQKRKKEKEKGKAEEGGGNEEEAKLGKENSCFFLSLVSYFIL